METIPKYDYTIERLRAGETVRCEECGKGFYRPSNPASDINHWYIYMLNDILCVLEKVSDGMFCSLLICYPICNISLYVIVFKGFL